MVYFALPVAQLFLQGVDQRFLFGQALFQQEDVVKRDLQHGQGGQQPLGLSPVDTFQQHRQLRLCKEHFAITG